MHLPLFIRNNITVLGVGGYILFLTEKEIFFGRLGYSVHLGVQLYEETRKREQI